MTTAKELLALSTEYAEASEARRPEALALYGGTDTRDPEVIAEEYGRALKAFLTS